MREDLERAKKIRLHRGLRTYWGLRVRGQHTKTTGRRGKTVGVRTSFFLLNEAEFLSEVGKRETNGIRFFLVGFIGLQEEVNYSLLCYTNGSWEKLVISKLVVHCNFFL